MSWMEQQATRWHEVKMGRKVTSIKIDGGFTVTWEDMYQGTTESADYHAVIVATVRPLVTWPTRRAGFPRWFRTNGLGLCGLDGAMPVYRDQPVVVVGGGDSACEEANVYDKIRFESVSGAPTRRTASVESDG